MTPEQDKLREDEPLYPYRHPNYGSHDWLKLVTVLRQRLIEAREQRDALKAWKKSAIAVEAEWDAQAVGRELGIGLGQSIRAGILPKVLALKAELAEAQNDTARKDWLRRRIAEEGHHYWDDAAIDAAMKEGK